ncbi:hypothetical protein NTE_02071 [Candidatus Nitrososphaera evergladensis SR1]|uniref:Uncharacterized protein n=1 Tax=Candidatus Nitrososphaera evergladensis SR1 TaxID=1459636 RepID=A0A075MTM7_9ARCH|nr:hypothetical protein NTE_02071 [Candidatus Nitrososphaera evergladensis SR1]
MRVSDMFGKTQSFLFRQIRDITQNIEYDTVATIFDNCRHPGCGSETCAMNWIVRVPLNIAIHTILFYIFKQHGFKCYGLVRL